MDFILVRAKNEHYLNFFYLILSVSSEELFLHKRKMPLRTPRR